MPLAGVVAGVAGVLLAVPALRVRGPYLAMVTIAFGFIVEQGAAELGWLTGGWNGLIGIPTPSLAGRKFAEREIAVLVLLLTALAFWLYARLAGEPVGQGHARGARLGGREPVDRPRPHADPHRGVRHLGGGGRASPAACSRP